MQHDKCPVCGFDEMPYPPVPYNVCPCCGTEFGVADQFFTPEALRVTWIASGMPWFSHIRRPPKGWNPFLQLINAGFGSDLVTLGSSATNSQESIYIANRRFWNRDEFRIARADALT